MALDTAQKQTIIETFKVHEKDTGSPEVQVALLTERIKMLTEHFKKLRERPQLAKGFADSCRHEKKTPQLSQGEERRQIQKAY